MKKNLITKLALLPMAFAVSACAINATDYRMTYDNTNADLSSLKQGKSCLINSSFSGWSGDATIGTAAKQGGISNVKYVEHITGDNSACIVVYGK